MPDAVPLIVAVAVTVREPTDALSNTPFVAAHATFALSAASTPESVHVMLAFGSVVVASYVLFAAVTLAVSTAVVMLAVAVGVVDASV